MYVINSNSLKKAFKESMEKTYKDFKVASKSTGLKLNRS